jgi:hypothetical protein
MNSKIIATKFFKDRKHFHLKNRRAVTDIISTMLLMAVTVSGATTLTYFVNEGFVSGNLATASTMGSSSLNILLLAYDARDSSTLLMLPNVNNQNNGFLCGSGVDNPACSGITNDIPANGGTEFIVFQIQNSNLDSLFLKDITLNGVVYSWDSSTSGIQLDTTLPLTGGKYPSDGTFSLLPVGSSPIFQDENIEIESGQIRNVLVKLSSADPDIKLNKGIRLFLDVGKIQLIEFLLVSGDLR